MSFSKPVSRKAQYWDGWCYCYQKLKIPQTEGTDSFDDHCTPSKPQGKIDSTSSPAVMAKAFSWLQACDSGHKICKASEPCAAWPTRLVHIGGQGQLPRLVPTATLAALPKYTTLSHCWGTRPTLRLMEANLEALVGGLRPNEVPKSYADAIEVTRALGVKYIWIDSLCIIQDSVADWQSESKNMASIYTHTYCNISALESADSHGGCFRQRDPSFSRPLLLRTQWVGLEDELWTWEFQRYSIEHGKEIEEAPVNYRAWVLQERQLAPRTLQFGRIMLYWECRETVSSEIQQFWPGVDDSVSPPDRLLIFRSETGLAIPAGSVLTENLVDCIERWTRVVEQYSAAALTFRSDKFVAISALARETKRVLDHMTNQDNQYLAGLWRPYLERQLIWQVAEPRPTSTQREDGFTAPSWSWASVDGRVYADYRMRKNVKLLAAVIGHHLVPIAGDPFLGVAPGSPASLTIWGPCWSLADDPSDRTKALGGEPPMELRLYWDIAIVSPSVRAPAYLLPLTLEPADPFIIHNWQVTLRGLLLERVSCSTMAFRRLGSFLIQAWRKGEQEDFSDMETENWGLYLPRIIQVGFKVNLFRLVDVPDQMDASATKADAWKRIVAPHIIKLE